MTDRGAPPTLALQQVLQQVLKRALKDLCKAWDAKYTSGFGAPRLKKKGEGGTPRLAQDCKYDPTAGTLHLPEPGQVRPRHSRQALGPLRNVTLRQERGRWVAGSLRCRPSARQT